MESSAVWILKTFAAHLTAIDGSLKLSPRQDNEPKLALALSATAVRLD